MRRNFLSGGLFLAGAAAISPQAVAQAQYPFIDGTYVFAAGRDASQTCFEISMSICNQQLQNCRIEDDKFVLGERRTLAVVVRCHFNDKSGHTFAVISAGAPLTSAEEVPAIVSIFRDRLTEDM